MSTGTDRPPPSPAELADLRAKAEAATPGPWSRDRDGEIEGLSGEHVATSYRDQDSAFIAAANPTTILALLDALEDEKMNYLGARADMRHAEEVAHALRAERDTLRRQRDALVKQIAAIPPALGERVEGEP